MLLICQLYTTERETVFDILCLLMLCLFFRNKHSIKSKLYQTKKKKMAVELFCVILSTCTATSTIYHYNYYSNCFVQLYLWKMVPKSTINWVSLPQYSDYMIYGLECTSTGIAFGRIKFTLTCEYSCLLAVVRSQ